MLFNRRFLITNARAPPTTNWTAHAGAYSGVNATANASTDANAYPTANASTNTRSNARSDERANPRADAISNTRSNARANTRANATADAGANARFNAITNSRTDANPTLKPTPGPTQEPTQGPTYRPPFNHTDVLPPTATPTPSPLCTCGINDTCCTSDCLPFSKGEVCRLAVGDCDQAEYCDGSSFTCPPDILCSPRCSFFLCHCFLLFPASSYLRFDLQNIYCSLQIGYAEIEAAGVTLLRYVSSWRRVERRDEWVITKKGQGERTDLILNFFCKGVWSERRRTMPARHQGDTRYVWRLWRRWV